jgi:hypothetical protein
MKRRSLKTRNTSLKQLGRRNIWPIIDLRLVDINLKNGLVLPQPTDMEIQVELSDDTTKNDQDWMEVAQVMELKKLKIEDVKHESK